MSHARWLRNLALTGLGGMTLALLGLRLAAPAYSQADQAGPGKYLGAGKCIEAYEQLKVMFMSS